MKQDNNVSKFLKISTIELKSQGAKSSRGSCEVFGVAPKGKSFETHKDAKKYHSLLERLNESGELSTNSGATCLVRFAEKESHVLFIGLGTDKAGIDALGTVERLRRLGANVMQKLSSEKICNAIVHLESFLMASADLELNPTDAAMAFAEGMGLAAYKFKKYIGGGKDSTKDPVSVALAATDSAKAKAYKLGVENAEAIIAGTYICRDLGNEPSNLLTPVMLAAYAKKLASNHGLKCTILDEKVMAREGMGLLLGVGQGSVNPPRLIVLEYNPAGAKKTTKTIAFVGKGITFDSGGISIKPSARMEDMKHDMCGAAAVIGAIVAAAELKVNARILTIVAAAENMPSGNAIQPGNILTSRAGKTVEISNTDAEGRLVLADALDFIQDRKPDYIIDLATLTGAISITLGKTCAGLMGNEASFNKLVHQAAKDSFERVWELPLFEEYFDDLKSEYADMRNSGDTPSHGAAKGAMFLKQFIRKGQPWVHLDIAAMAYGIGGIPYYPKKSSTGYGVRLLVELAKNIG